MEKRERHLIRAVALAAGILLLSYAPAMAADDAGTVQGLVDRAHATFNEFMRDPQFTWLHQNLDNAKGVLIFPQVLKGGLIVGGSGGTGVLLAKDEKTGEWSQPAFYTFASLTFGFQIGGETAEMVMLAMTEKAIDSLLSSSFLFGGDASVAAGPVGIGAKADATVDFYSFMKSKGLYAGLNLEGAVVQVRDSLNSTYYGKDVRPVDILVKKDVDNKGSAELRAALKEAEKRA